MIRKGVIISNESMAYGESFFWISSGRQFETDNYQRWSQLADELFSKIISPLCPQDVAFGLQSEEGFRAIMKNSIGFNMMLSIMQDCFHNFK